MRLLVAAAVIASSLLSGCSSMTTGTAQSEKHPRVPIENTTSSSESVAAQDIVTDLVAYWGSRDVSLDAISFRQWDSANGDSPPMCHGSVFPQPAFCSDGWLAWDRAWVRRAVDRDQFTSEVYFSRAVSDAVAYAVVQSTGSPEEQECLMGAYMSLRTDTNTMRPLRGLLTDVGEFVKGMESRDPIRDCLLR